MTVSNGDTLRITAKLSNQGISDVLNVFHMAMEMTTPQDDDIIMGEIAVDLDATYALINSDIAGGYVYETIEFYNVTQDAPMGAEAWPTLNNGGEVVNQPMSAQIAGQVNFPTGIKKSQGRKYIGGYTEAANEGSGVINSAVKTRLESWGGQFTQPLAVTGGTGNWGHLDASGTVFRTWITHNVPTLLATQRRRKLNVGS